MSLHEMYDKCMIKMHEPSLYYDFSEFWKFFRNRPTAIHSRQAAYTILCLFLVSWGNRLAVRPCTARRRRLITRFWVSLMNCLAVMNFRQATRVLDRFCDFVHSGRILIGKESRVSGYKMIDVGFC